MTRNVKWRITAIGLLLMAVTNGMAQMSKEFMNATNRARNNITLPVPIGEYNEYTVPPTLDCITSTSDITVCALLRPGDYDKYYKGKPQADLTKVYLWVFEPTSTSTKFKAKVPNTKDRTWKRFCQFLGLDSITIKQKSTKIGATKTKNYAIRDTLIFLKVSPNSLFRPAYDTDIKVNNIGSTQVPAFSTATQHYYVMRSSTDPEINKWFGNEQCHNTYPWTRLGYTYDWGDPTNHVGATEFILKPGTYTLTTSPKKTGQTYDIVANFFK